jgi:plasmid stability protein
MTNLTLAVDEDVLRRARIRALEQGTSVNALLREYLGAFAAGQERREKAIADLLDLAARTTAGSGGRRGWSRDDLHDRG